MLDLDNLRNVKLSKSPKAQRFVGRLMRHLDYKLPKKTEIEFEGLDNLPTDRPIFLAMNHTDRFNYWPLQLGLHLEKKGYTATWVKGKYYENSVMARFLGSVNGIPLPSRGYVITTQFRDQLGRPPEAEEYRALRTLINAGAWDAAPTPEARQFVDSKGGDAAFTRWFEDLWADMMAEVVAINRRAFDLGLYVLVFPQGTRSIKLSKGHVGLAQMSQHLGADIVPIGCNGSDRLYPGNSPLSKGGRVLYRVGEPLTLDGEAIGQYRIQDHFVPFSRSAEELHGDKFRAITDVMMDRINDLLDPEYQYSEDQASDGVEAMNRFI